MGKKEDPGNFRLISLKLIPGRVMEQLILEANPRHVNNKKKITRSRQHGLPKGKGLNNLRNLFDRVTGLVDEGSAVNIVYLDSVRPLALSPIRSL